MKLQSWASLPYETDFNSQTGSILNDRIVQPLRKQSSKNSARIAINPNRCLSRHWYGKRQVVR
jgi:hypothetical protein